MSTLTPSRPSRAPLRRRSVLLTTAAVLVLLGAVAGGLAAGGVFSRADRQVSRPHPPGGPAGGQRPTGGPPKPTAAPITAAQVRDLLSRYTASYDAEDIGRLGALLAPDVVRQNDGEPPDHKRAAIAEYTDQFRKFQNLHYVLSGLSVTPGSNKASASGNYAIRTQTGTTTGSIQFDIIARRGNVLINRITIQPNEQ